MRTVFSTRITQLSATLLLATTSLLCACNDDLPKATVITHMRVLGARTEVMGDPTRSTPKPGESATMTWAMAFPSIEDDDSQVSSLFITCTAPTRFTGIPICQEFIDAALSPDKAVGGMLDELSIKSFSCKGAENSSLALESIGITCVSGTPKLDVKIESDAKVSSRLVRGILCQNGTPYLDPKDPELFKCKRNSGVKASNAEAIAVYGTIPIQLKAKDANGNPSMSDASFKFHDSAWPLLDISDLPSTDDDCASQAKSKVLLVTDGLTEELEIAFTAKAREKDGEGELESIEFSTYVTGGEISQRFVVFEADNEIEGGKLKHLVTWKMSKAERDEITSKGKLVRFLFTVLDRRGGFDITEREICVLP